MKHHAYGLIFIFVTIVCGTIAVARGQDNP
jgi:hypothetical protein